jgi:hypothetical protein
MFPASFISLMPAAYAWQVYGWGVGIGVYLLSCVLLLILGWMFHSRRWTYRRLVAARVILIVFIMAAIGLSAMEVCDLEMTACHRVFWPN